jgi:hypothetical protein
MIMIDSPFNPTMSRDDNRVDVATSGTLLLVILK